MRGLGNALQLLYKSLKQNTQNLQGELSLLIKRKISNNIDYYLSLSLFWFFIFLYILSSTKEYYAILIFTRLHIMYSFFLLDLLDN